MNPIFTLIISGILVGTAACASLPNKFSIPGEGNVRLGTNLSILSLVLIVGLNYWGAISAVKESSLYRALVMGSLLAIPTCFAIASYIFALRWGWIALAYPVLVAALVAFLARPKTDFLGYQTLGFLFAMVSFFTAGLTGCASALFKRRLDGIRKPRS